MAGGYYISESDYRRLRDIFAWWDTYGRTLKNNRIKKPPRLSGGAGGNVRAAVIGTVASDHLQVYLVDYNSSTGNQELSDEVTTVWCDRHHIGENPLTGEIWPTLERDVTIPVYKDRDGRWYPDFMIDDRGPC